MGIHATLRGASPSPEARGALIWILQDTGWQLRGSKISQKKHPQDFPHTCRCFEDKNSHDKSVRPPGTAPPPRAVRSNRNRNIRYVHGDSEPFQTTLTHHETQRRFARNLAMQLQNSIGEGQLSRPWGTYRTSLDNGYFAMPTHFVEFLRFQTNNW